MATAVRHGRRQRVDDTARAARARARRARPTASRISAASGRRSTKRTGICRRTRRVPAAVTQQGVYPYAYAEVPAAPVLALGAAAGVPGSLGVVQGDGQIPYTPEAAAIKKGERARTGSIAIRSSSAICPAFRARCTCPTRFRSSRAPTKIQMIYTFSNAARTDSSGQGRRPARRHLDGPLGRPLGRRHARRRRDAFQRQDLVRQGGQFPQRRAARRRALHADRRRRDAVRGDDRGSERLHAAVDDRDAASIAGWSRTSSSSTIPASSSPKSSCTDISASSNW